MLSLNTGSRVREHSKPEERPATGLSQSLLIEMAIIVAKNPSRKPREVRESANRKVNSAP